MFEISLSKTIESEILLIPELKYYIGRIVNIRIIPEEIRSSKPAGNLVNMI